MATNELELGLVLPSDAAGLPRLAEFARAADAAGYHSVWTGEAWGSDAVTPLAFAAAITEGVRLGSSIMAISARPPAVAVSTAATLDLLSGGRFLLGLGVSGPQVVEGWHGTAFTSPLDRRTEYVQVVRQALAGTEPLRHDGAHHRLPYDGADATGLGKPLRPMLGPRPGIPILVAAITPTGVRNAGRIADGLLPIWMDPDRPDVLLDHAAAGRAEVGKTLDGFVVAPLVPCVVGDDVDACRMPVRAQLARYIGAMGARSANFYNRYAAAMGYGSAAARIQDAYLSGDRDGAARAVPDDLVDAVSLVGPPDRVRERLASWRRSPVGILIVQTADLDTVRLLPTLTAGPVDR